MQGIVVAAKRNFVNDIIREPVKDKKTGTRSEPGAGSVGKFQGIYCSGAPVNMAGDALTTALSPHRIYSHLPKNFWNSAPI